LPSFNENFDAKNGITNADLNNQLLEIINAINCNLQPYTLSNYYCFIAKRYYIDSFMIETLSL
jgi:hypothetical protein